MKMTSVLASAILISMLSLQASALGLGQLTIESHLSEPLMANIPLKLGATENIEDVHVAIASQEVFKKMGIEYGFEHTRVKVSIDQTANTYRIMLSTKTPFNEPFIELVVNIKTPTQQFNRSLTLLLDAPNNASATSVFK